MSNSMDINNYFKEEQGYVYFDEEQASQFAKGVAGDFNPIHDPGSRRFCVPGDLLFAVLLHRYGLAQNTSVEYCGMLDAKTRMPLPETMTGELKLMDARDLALLNFSQEGVLITNGEFIEQLTQRYVQFSGHTFPDILVPLMKDAGVMINPARPLVIYKDMSINFTPEAQALFIPSDADTLSEMILPLGEELSLELVDSSLDVNGRKGAATLEFTIEVSGKKIGSGQKNLLLSGLREYEQETMDTLVNDYNLVRNSYMGK